MEYKTSGIFNTFRRLTKKQLRENARYVISFAAPFAFMAIGVAIAVSTGIFGIGPIFGALGVAGLIFVCSRIKCRYTPRFGIKYNLLRFGIAGFLLYRHTAWNGLLGLYNKLTFRFDGFIPFESYILAILTFGLLTVAVAAYGLSKTENAQIADLLGVYEVFGAVLTFGAFFAIII